MRISRFGYKEWLDICAIFLKDGVEEMMGYPICSMKSFLVNISYIYPMRQVSQTPYLYGIHQQVYVQIFELLGASEKKCNFEKAYILIYNFKFHSIATCLIRNKLITFEVSLICKFEPCFYEKSNRINCTPSCVLAPTP